MTAPSVGDLVELDVARAGAGGVCVGRHPDGRAVLVRHTLPGERVRARLTDVRSRFARADAVEVLAPSPHRVEPPCPYAGPGRCGGCDLQHVALAEQRRWKAAVLLEQLARLGGVPDEEMPDVVVSPVPGDDDGLGWRTRVGFAVRPDGVVGLHRHRSREVEPVDRCLLASDAVAALDVPGRRWPGVASVAVEASADGDGALVVVTPRRQGADGRVVLPELDADVGVLRRPAPRSPRLDPVEGRTRLDERVGDRTFSVRAGGFWQVHPGAAQAVADAVLDLGRPAPGERVLDLYAGAGPLTAALAQAVGASGDVLGVEGDAGAAQDAVANLRDLPRARVVVGRVDARLPAFSQAWDLVVLDPPRAGAGREVTATLLRCARRAVVYVACDAASLARDVAVARELGWRLAAVRGLDLFPMTAHVEAVALLEPDGRPPPAAG